MLRIWVTQKPRNPWRSNIFLKGYRWKNLGTDEDQITVAALLARLYSDDLICCYCSRVTQKDNLIDLSIDVLFNLRAE